ncbi:MAG: protein kinase [Gammaproteobacteria bacterium]|nr:protein kinase [Gammaproteobacteria bacterium]MBU1446868.1 protein kinase [Gammaproteobacteria bacterium]MDD2928826.1 protein kinase [Sideroxydans sp.]MDD5471000.1 protein kinase [Sideroxydans sp.]
MDENSAVSSSAMPEQVAVVSVIIRDFIHLTERLSTEGLARLMGNYYEKVEALVAQQQGVLSSVSNHGMLVTFPFVPASDHPARRALRFSLSIALIAYQMRFLIRQSFPEAGLDHFGIGVGIHSGEVMSTQLGVAPYMQRVVSGHAVAVASLLAGKSKELDWNVVCSEQTCEAIGRGVRVRRRAEIGADWLKQPVRVVEVLVVREVEGEDVEATMRMARGSRSGHYKAFEPLLFEPGEEAIQMNLPQVPGYRCLKPVGRGGMSSVFLAERLSDKKLMALKFADSSVSEDSEVLYRFVEEYGLLEQVRHPHVLQIYDQGVTDDAVFIVMEYLPGGTLKQRIGQQGLEAGDAWRVLREIVQALIEVHERGIIHRDIKPENIMLRDDGSAVLGDFGVARRMHEVRADGCLEAVVATPYFMSPEQALGMPEDDRTDIYSMGAVFYNMLTALKPYTGDTLESIVQQHLTAATPSLQPKYRHWQPLLDGMMAKDKSQRHSARTLMAHMDTFKAMV